MAQIDLGNYKSVYLQSAKGYVVKISASFDKLSLIAQINQVMKSQ